MPTEPKGTIESQDKLRNRVAAGLRAEQALPFIRPYIEMRRAELLDAMKIYADNSNRDKVFETAVRLSEIETIILQLKVDTIVGRKADARLSGQ